VKVTYVLDIDEEKLDEYTRGLYAGAPTDPVMGEPTPALHLAAGWIGEAKHSLAEGYGPDTIWWVSDDGSNNYVRSVTITSDKPCQCEHCRAQ
jgi:hypothetical protein